MTLNTTSVSSLAAPFPGEALFPPYNVRILRMSCLQVDLTFMLSLKVQYTPYTYRKVGGQQLEVC